MAGSVFVLGKGVGDGLIPHTHSLTHSMLSKVKTVLRSGDK